MRPRHGSLNVANPAQHGVSESYAWGQVRDTARQIQKWARDNQNLLPGGLQLHSVAHYLETLAGQMLRQVKRGVHENPRPRRTRRRMGLIKDMRFFREHSGGIVGEGSRRGLDLARAEREMQRRGWVVTWEPDNDADWSWMSDEERKREHEVYVAILWNTDPERSRRPGHMNATVLASLGGIFDPDQKYMRVIEAELASEALSGL